MSQRNFPDAGGIDAGVQLSARPAIARTRFLPSHRLAHLALTGLQPEFTTSDFVPADLI
ncbi:MAG: hypothetical protein K8963_00925 [Proteobacteria bacterium]|nr:hypothetical protein [Pseudomonadota bacterium]